MDQAVVGVELVVAHPPDVRASFGDDVASHDGAQAVRRPPSLHGGFVVHEDDVSHLAQRRHENVVDGAAADAVEQRAAHVRPHVERDNLPLVDVHPQIRRGAQAHAGRARDHVLAHELAAREGHGRRRVGVGRRRGSVAAVGRGRRSLLRRDGSDPQRLAERRRATPRRRRPARRRRRGGRPEARARHRARHGRE